LQKTFGRVVELDILVVVGLKTVWIERDISFIVKPVQVSKQ
jgi:hypothetical protein